MTSQSSSEARTRTRRWIGVATAGLAAVNCSSAQVHAVASAEEESPRPVVLSEEGERYLTDVYLFTCAPEYLPYPEGEGPPVPVRTPVERKQREEELTTCVREVALKYTKLETVRMMTWNGKGHSMSNAEMNGIVRYGAAFLDDYVKGLVEGERQREGVSRNPVLGREL